MVRFSPRNIWVGPRPVAVYGCPFWGQKTGLNQTCEHYTRPIVALEDGPQGCIIRGADEIRELHKYDHTPLVVGTMMTMAVQPQHLLLEQHLRVTVLAPGLPSLMMALSTCLADGFNKWQAPAGNLWVLEPSHPGTPPATRAVVIMANVTFAWTHLWLPFNGAMEDQHRLSLKPGTLNTQGPQLLCTLKQSTLCWKREASSHLTVPYGHATWAHVGSDVLDGEYPSPSQ